MSIISKVELADDNWLFLLIFVFLLVLIGQLLRERRIPIVNSTRALAQSAHSTFRLRLRFIPQLLLLVAIMLTVIALADPRHGVARKTTAIEGYDLVMLVDVSSSMELQKADGITKLQTTKQIIREFVRKQDQGRVGVVVFQSTSLLLSPLSYDLIGIDRQIDRIESGWLEDGTAIGDGIIESLSLLVESNSKSRVVILLTDGENNEGLISPVEAAQLSRSLGIRIYVIAVTLPNQIFDTRELEMMSNITDGEFFDASTSVELAVAYQSIADLEFSEIATREFLSSRSYAPALALVASVFVGMTAVLSVTVFRRNV